MELQQLCRNITALSMMAMLGKCLLSLSPLCNETQASQTDVVQLYLSEIFLSFIILGLAPYLVLYLPD